MIAVTTRVGPSCCRNLVLVDFHDARERKQKLFHREWMIRLAKKNCRQQVRTVVPVDESFAIAISGGDVTRARFGQALIDHRVDAIGDLRIDKRRELRVFVISGARNDLGQSFRQRLADLFDVCGRPDRRSIDTRTTAIVGDRSDHHVEILLPVVDAIFADDDLAVAWSVYLDARIVGPHAGR